MPRITIIYTSRVYRLVKLLYDARIIQNYLITTKNNTKSITFSSYHYKNVAYFSHLKIVSTPSNPQTISLQALRTITTALGGSILLLETDRGVITHYEAISYKTGGRILGIIS